MLVSDFVPHDIAFRLKTDVIDVYLEKLEMQSFTKG